MKTNVILSKKTKKMIPCTKYTIDRKHGFQVVDTNATMQPWKTVHERDGEGVIRIFHRTLIRRESQKKITFPQRKKRDSVSRGSKKPMKSIEIPMNPVDVELPEFTLEDAHFLLTENFNDDQQQQQPMLIAQDIIIDPTSFQCGDINGIYENLTCFLDNPALSEYQWDRLCTLDSQMPYNTIKSICTHEEWSFLGKTRHTIMVSFGSWVWNNLMMRFVRVQKMEKYMTDPKSLSSYYGSGKTRFEESEGAFISVEVLINTIRSWDTMMGMQFLNQETDQNVEEITRLYMRFLACLYWNLRDQLLTAGYNDWGNQSRIPSQILESTGFCKVMENLHKLPDTKAKFDPSVFIYECSLVWQTNVVPSFGTFVSPFQTVMKVADEMNITVGIRKKVVDMMLCTAWSDIYFAWNAVDVSVAVIHCINRMILLASEYEGDRAIPVEMGRNIISLACNSFGKTKGYDNGDRVARTRALSHEIMYIYMNHKKLIELPFLKDAMLC